MRHQSLTMTKYMKFVTALANWYSYAPLALLLLLLPQARYKVGIPAAAVLFTVTLINQVLKHSFRVVRPNINQMIHEGGFSFPSAHAMVTTAFIGFLCYLFFFYTLGNLPKYLLLILSVMFILNVGISRVYLGVHTTTDVIAGFCAGLFLLLPAIYIMEKYYVNTKFFLEK